MQNELLSRAVYKSKIKVELDLSNYATKSDLKRVIDIDASVFAKKADLVKN